MESLKCYCTFIGYPASGHSVVGAFIDAHKNAIVSHELNAAQRIWSNPAGREELFRDIKAKSAKQEPTRSSFNHSGVGRHRYHFPNLCQGAAEELHVIGDKQGARTSRLAAQVGGEELVSRIRVCVNLPLRVILVTRNPYDMVVARRGQFGDIVKDFMTMSRGTKSFLAALDEDEVLQFRHEKMIESPRATIESLCEFLSLEPYADYVDTCANSVLTEPTNPRLRRDWNQAEIDLVEGLIDVSPWLAGYDLEGNY